MEQALSNCNFVKHNWFTGWYIGSTLYKATTQEEATSFQHEYELYHYFRNRGSREDDTDDETEVDDETEDEDKTDDETDDEG